MYMEYNYNALNLSIYLSEIKLTYKTGKYFPDGKVYEESFWIFHKTFLLTYLSRVSDGIGIAWNTTFFLLIHSLAEFSPDAYESVCLSVLLS